MNFPFVKVMERETCWLKPVGSDESGSRKCQDRGEHLTLVPVRSFYQLFWLS